MQRNLLLWFFLVVMGLFQIHNTAVLAVPAAPITFEISQPDGTKFIVKQEGDEWLHWIETEDGYTVLEDRPTGWWYYAEPDEIEGIRISTHPVGKVNPEDIKIKKGLRPKQKRLPKIPQDILK